MITSFLSTKPTNSVTKNCFRQVRSENASKILSAQLPSLSQIKLWTTKKPSNIVTRLNNALTNRLSFAKCFPKKHIIFKLTKNSIKARLLWHFALSDNRKNFLILLKKIIKCFCAWNFRIIIHIRLKMRNSSWILLKKMT